MAGMDKAYLADLQRLLEAEKEMKGQDIDLLADPEYCAMREQFIDGAITLEQLADRIDALAASRPDEEEAVVDGGAASLAELMGGDGLAVDPDDDRDESDDDLDDDPDDGTGIDRRDVADGASNDGRRH